MSDQDDIWHQGRSDLMINYLSKSPAMLLTSNFSWIDKNDKPIKISFDGVSSSHSARNLLNIYDIFIGKTNYFGCAMVFKRNLLIQYALYPDTLSHTTYGLRLQAICINQICISMT